jgi:hypothetical protein
MLSREESINFNVIKANYNKEYFKNFRVEFGTLTWGNSDTDIAPETLYTKATGKFLTLEEEIIEFHKQ